MREREGGREGEGEGDGEGGAEGGRDNAGITLDLLIFADILCHWYC